ncbi:hypothetical protein GMRT_10152 [Giardia muris]|uniref:Uncharacterized protein n=1 Tax=Giardia muris TaxID=5742 RepID=A0A4Z1T2G4_GIAMU|nr:hypothetical protein GMRT_10152 [Giardia muris]|eukprot:TNJ26779.1 hypothetical protein GMRT_10152 [Giardia muris]
MNPDGVVNTFGVDERDIVLAFFQGSSDNTLCRKYLDRCTASASLSIRSRYRLHADGDISRRKKESQPISMPGQSNPSSCTFPQSLPKRTLKRRSRTLRLAREHARRSLLKAGEARQRGRDNILTINTILGPTPSKSSFEVLESGFQHPAYQELSKAEEGLKQLHDELKPTKTFPNTPTTAIFLFPALTSPRLKTRLREWGGLLVYGREKRAVYVQVWESILAQQRAARLLVRLCEECDHRHETIFVGRHFLCGFGHSPARILQLETLTLKSIMEALRTTEFVAIQLREAILGLLPFTCSASSSVASLHQRRRLA